MNTALIVSVLASLLGAAAPGQIVETPETKVIPKLTVRGEAELLRPADQLQIAIGVETEAPEAPAALDANTQRMAAVVKAIEGLGLKREEYQTGRFRIMPVHSRRPRQAEPEWEPKIVGYQVVNTINVKTTRLDLAGQLIDTANKAGANTIDNIAFDLKDPRAYRSEAISEATANAVADARVLAAAAGVTLKRLLAINLDNAELLGRDMQATVRGRMAAAEAGPPPITPGEVTLRASVSLVYEIEQGSASSAAPAKDERP